MEQTINEKIAMAMLMQCALVWEHCTESRNAGRFNLGQVRQGVSGKTSSRLRSKPGLVDMDLENVKWEGAFRLKLGQIEGVTLTPENYIRLEQGGFSCGYWLADVWSVADRFCQCNIPWMGNKVEFGCDGKERWAVMPEQKKAGKAKAAAAPKKEKKTMPPSLEDRLRQALLARLTA